ncbi:hypothetical protein [Streptomyces sp. NPDC004376]
MSRFTARAQVAGFLVCLTAVHVLAETAFAVRGREADRLEQRVTRLRDLLAAAMHPLYAARDHAFTDSIESLRRHLERAAWGVADAAGFVTRPLRVRHGGH